MGAPEDLAGTRPLATLKTIKLMEELGKIWMKVSLIRDADMTDKEQLALLNYSVGSRIFKKVKMHLKSLHLISDHRTHLSRNATGKNTFFVNLLAPELCSFFM